MVWELIIIILKIFIGMLTMRYQDDEAFQAAEESRRYRKIKVQSRKQKRKQVRNSRKSWRRFRANNECNWGKI